MNRRRRLCMQAAACLAAALLGGCGIREAFTSKSSGEKEYGLAETMMIITTERLRYESLYTDQIWTAAVDNRGTTFETALLSQIHDFLREVKLMSRMAGEEGIALSSRERELVKAAAVQYMDELGEETAAELELEEQTAAAFYTDYWLSEKLVEQLTGGVDLEVSDSEARVIEVQEIRLDSPEEAGRVLELVRAENADFSSLAKEYSLDGEIQKKIYRGMYGAEYEEAAYGLSEGEISGVLPDDGSWYILKCVNDYDESATRLHKEQMILRKKNEAFYSAYQSYKEEVTLTGDGELWSGLSISGSPETTADFFEIYEENIAVQ